MKERVRFAPSPTGPLHIGGLRTALFNYLFTKGKKGSFILRIEDTDRNRFVEKSDDYIERALSWAGIITDESPSKGGEFGPYRQSERIDIYKEKINELITAGKAYYAFDSGERLAELRALEEKKGKVFKYDRLVRGSLDNSLSMKKKDITDRVLKDSYVVRLKVEDGETISEDLLRGHIRVNNQVLDDKILIKADGYPTYHFANVVDDHMMNITTVIRGEEWLPSLPLHNLIYDAFNWNKPSFIHLPLILKPNGKGKLSKRDGIEGGFPVFPLKWKEEKGFREMGFTSEGIVNYLALLGWSPGDDKEVFTFSELQNRFSVKGIQKGGAKFDFEKAKWVNHQHLSKMSFFSFEKLFPNLFIEIKKKYPTKCEGIYMLVRERLKLAGDLKEETSFLLENPTQLDEKVLNKLMSKTDVEKLTADIIRIVEVTGVNELKENLIELSDNRKIGIGIIMQLIRLSFIGKMSGPDIIKAANLMEKDVTLERLLNLKKNLTK